MTTVIATILVFGLLVLVHELGHFITAKLTGMRVSEFAIGLARNCSGRNPVKRSIRAGDSAGGI